MTTMTEAEVKALLDAQAQRFALEKVDDYWPDSTLHVEGHRQAAPLMSRTWKYGQDERTESYMLESVWLRGRLRQSYAAPVASAAWKVHRAAWLLVKARARL